jgi:glutamine synthetase type III
MTSAFFSPSETSARCSPAMSPSSAVISSRSHMRISSATWSLRERAVCSFAPAGTRFVSSASMFMWTSSSAGFHENFPAAISLPIWSRPRMIACSSFFVRTPILQSISAWAIEPRMSCRHRRQSKEMDSVNWATSALTLLAKRPLRETGDLLFIGRLVFNAKTQRRQDAKSFIAMR